MVRRSSDGRGRTSEWRGGGGRLSFAQGTVTSLTACTAIRENGDRPGEGRAEKREREGLARYRRIHPSIERSHKSRGLVLFGRQR